VVIGNSLGGQIAIELGLAYPAWTRALVLAAPAGRFGAGVQAMRWAIGAAARPAVLRIALPWALARGVHDPSLPACEERRRILVERLVAEDYPGFARAITRSLVGSIAAGHQPLAQLTQPTLLVWGRNDRLVGLSGSRRVLRALPHARLAVLERCGHLPMLEQPQQFNRVVADFLRPVEDVPYNVVIVELEEGIRLHSNVVGCANEELRVGMPVEVVFDKVSDEVTLPRFRPQRLG